MTPYDLKDAFGETPQRVKDCVARSLRTEERSEPIMKKKLSLSLIAAALAALLLAGAALAAVQRGLLADWLGVYNEETGNKMMIFCLEDASAVLIDMAGNTTTLI